MAGDVSDLSSLVASLQLKGVSLGHISRVLGYSGCNGPRDMASVVRGTSRKASIAEACAMLQQYSVDLDSSTVYFVRTASSDSRTPPATKPHPPEARKG